MPTLYSFGNAANVSANNFTTLYNSGAGVVNPQVAYGNANVVGLLAVGTDGGNTVGNIIASGNITAQNFIGNIIGNLNVPGGNTEVLFNDNGNAGASANFTFNSATNILNVAGNVTATGNVTAGNVVQGNIIISTTDIKLQNQSAIRLYENSINGTQAVSIIAPAAFASSYTLELPITNGDSGQVLTTDGGSPTVAALSWTTPYGNANVVSLLSAFGSNAISTTGNVTAGNILSLGVVSAGGNISTPNYLNTNTGLLFGALSSRITESAGTITIYANNTGHLSIANAGVNVSGTGFNVANNISASGNITGNYFLGNGSQLTGLPAGYSNAQVAAYLASGTNTSNIITTGNVSGTYILGNGSQLTGLPSGYSNAQVASYLASGTNSSNIITTGNITGSNILTAGLISTTSSIIGNVANIVGQGNSLTVTDGNIVAGKEVFISGNLFVSSSTINAGVITATGNITGNYIKGNGAFLTGVTATLPANITGTSLSVTGNITGGNLTVAGMISATGGPIISGTLSATSNVNAANGVISNTLTVGIGNITTVNAATVSVAGNISGGNISTTGNITAGTGSFFIGNGSLLTGITTSYGNTNVAAYLASGGLTSNITTTGNVTGGNILTGGNIILTALNSGITVGGLGNISSGGNINVTGLITASGSITSGSIISAAGNITSGDKISAAGNVTGLYFIGNGSQLTGIATTSANAFGNISVTGQTTVAANSSSATLQLVAGTNITITTDAANGKITVNSSASGGGSSLADIFLLMGA